jgi:hypothetical protein
MRPVAREDLAVEPVPAAEAEASTVVVGDPTAAVVTAKLQVSWN